MLIVLVPDGCTTGVFRLIAVCFIDSWWWCLELCFLSQLILDVGVALPTRLCRGAFLRARSAKRNMFTSLCCACFCFFFFFVVRMLLWCYFLTAIKMHGKSYKMRTHTHTNIMNVLYSILCSWTFVLFVFVFMVHVIGWFHSIMCSHRHPCSVLFHCWRNEQKKGFRSNGT